MNEIQSADKRLRRLLPLQKAQPDTEYIPSRFTMSFSHKGKQYVFNTLTKQCLEAELPSSCAGRDGYDDLIEGYFLVPQDRDECAFFESILAIMKAYYHDEEIPEYTLLTTFACNARCVYCYEEGSVPISMNAETADQAVRYIGGSRIGGKPVNIRWFGGEPLIGETMIDRICQGLQDNGVAFYSTMISNGSLVTPSIVEKMTGPWKFKSVQISMDGDEEDYKRRKRYCEYRDDYHRVMEGVNLMSEAGIPVTVRCNVDEENIRSVPRFLEDLRESVRFKKNVSVYLTPLDDVCFGENDLWMWKEILAVDPLIEAAGFKTISYGGIGLVFRIYHCVSAKGSPAIGPDGSLYPCKHCLKGSRYGDIWNGVTEDRAKKAFCGSDRVPVKCRECPFLPVCVPFSSCPVKDRQCREVQHLLTEEALCRLIDRREGQTASAEGRPGC